jgi:hypothetical protein
MVKKNTKPANPAKPTNVSTLMVELQALIRADVPVLLWSVPGTGKTASVTAAAAAAGAHLEVIIGSTMDPTDLGRPYMAEDGVEIAPPPWARRLAEARDRGQEAWLMLDELTCAPPSIQAALLRVVNERAVGPLSIKGCRIIAAANPQDSAADGIELSQATANRWCHLDFQADPAVWCAGEASGWGLKEEGLSGVRGYVTGWIANNPGALLSPPPSDATDIRGWASPRSWSMLCRALGYMAGNASEARAKEVISSKPGRTIMRGLIGDGPACEFSAWVQDTDIPSAVDLLENRAQLPERGDKQALCTAMCIALAITDPAVRFRQFWSLCVKMRKDLGLIAARKGLDACETAGIDPQYTSDLQELVQTYREVH